MSEPMTDETARVIVVVRMADDLHHLLGRVAAALCGVAAFFALSLMMDLLARDWFSVAAMAAGVVGFGLMGRDTWKRRSKYARRELATSAGRTSAATHSAVATTTLVQ